MSAVTDMCETNMKNSSIFAFKVKNHYKHLKETNIEIT